jgi:CRISPR locus-related DNA-binding protein
MTVLISTIFKGSAVIQAIKLFEPKKVYFLVDDPIDDIRKHSVNMIKDIFPSIEFEQISAKIYDIVEIAQKTIEVIEKESLNKIIVHISEGRKTMTLGVLFGAYVLREKVDSAYYIVEETNSPIRLPLIALKVSAKKHDLLKLISQGQKSTSELQNEMKITAATLYVHIKELRDDGLLSKNNKLTEMGEIVLLNQKK